jgi:hypothetical protein
LPHEYLNFTILSGLEDTLAHLMGPMSFPICINAQGYSLHYTIHQLVDSHQPTCTTRQQPNVDSLDRRRGPSNKEMSSPTAGDTLPAHFRDARTGLKPLKGVNEVTGGVVGHKGQVPPLVLFPSTKSWRGKVYDASLIMLTHDAAFARHRGTTSRKFHSE